MSDQDGTSRSRSANDTIDALADRLDAARRKHLKPDEKPTSAMALGFKYATEFTVATLVGAALGFGIDKLVGTSPWGLLAGLVLGLCAGVREIILSAQKGMEQGQTAISSEDPEQEQ
ncbi:MAG: AtpZ/AtpI family protein [Hyphomonadaceae bacterium]|nr:AtpZ/AtpI family protein [Hyphomonadaceae bacterium]MBC6412102.1 AtpZ/AtpI family protein [Hyphomonadaceae bacterium]